jgi:hypothetical protein
MATVKLRKTRDRISPSAGRIVAKFEKLPQRAYEYWKGITPIDTGNARARTRLQGRKIKANYNYAVPLDKGWSKQAPRGMSQPTEQYIKKLITREILRK